MAKKQAQALQIEGLRLLEKGDDRGALDKFEEAYRLVPSPKILFNRAKAHLGLGEEVEALSDFERFLDEAPYAPKRSRDEATRAAEALRPKLAYLEIEVQDAGSAITLDSHDIGVSPLPRPVVVAPGAHEVRVSNAGMKDELRKVAPIAGQKLRIVVQLTPAAAPVAAAVVSPLAAAPAVDTSGSGAGATDAKPPAPAGSTDEGAGSGRPWQRTAAWAAVGAGVVFLGAGVTAQVLSSGKSADFNAVTDAPNATHMCNQKLPSDGGGSCQSLNDQANKWRTWAYVGYAASGVALASALIFYLTSPSSQSGARETVAACGPSASHGVSCALTLTF